MSLSEEDKNDIMEMVSVAISKNVNGKIDALSNQVKPLTDMLSTWSHMKAQMMFWIGGIFALGGAVQAIQALWGLIAPHIKS